MHIENVFALSQSSPTPKPITHIGTNARVFVVDDKAFLKIAKFVDSKIATQVKTQAPYNVECA